MQTKNCLQCDLCRYPTRSQYDQTISSLMLEYPFLHDYDGSGVSYFPMLITFFWRSKFVTAIYFLFALMTCYNML